ncbi:DUF389 domain-containing protein [Desulfolutivibrio sp.]|uniref:DUF389 domain-containing protein n=1 Tax=Desulfolutivibrio sp. TaxID=2773296 RepID=UPI002F9686D7
MDGSLAASLRRFRVTDDKADGIVADITRGSTPGAGFYALIATAALIASLGLVANSPAVIIGAMLVSPLMSPIFGISLGMIRGDAGLMGKSIRAEISGMALAVAFGALFGLLPVMTEVTPEMLARTQPTLLDLLVAVFAGFAGTLAMVDDRISPALPGVAIATAIVPPLATCGLCLASGANQGALGAFLLFFANFVAILLVSALTFLAAGLAKGHGAGGGVRRVAGNMALAVLGFLLVSAYLTSTLASILADHRQDDQTRAAIERALADDPNVSLASMQRKDMGQGVDVLAVVRTPRYLEPAQVAEMEKAVSDSLGKDVRLAVRCILNKDIFPPGGAAMVAAPSLDGALFTDKAPADVKRLQLAEQTLREIVSAMPQILLLDVDLVHMAGEPVILATMQSPRTLIPSEIGGMEKTLRDRLGESDIRLLARCQTPEDVAADGRILFGRAHFGPKDAPSEAVAGDLRTALAGLPEMFVTAMDVVHDGQGYLARAEIVGTRLITPAEVREVENRVSAAAGAPVSLAAWSRVALMVTDTRYLPVEEYTRQRLAAGMGEAEKPLPAVDAAGPPAP